MPRLYPLLAALLVSTLTALLPISAPAQSFGPQDTITTNASGAQSVYAADLDGDGDKDVLSASTISVPLPSYNDKIAWYENQGGGSFGPQQVITINADGANDVYATDLDGDGDADVLSASENDGKIAWYENQGGGSFGPQQVITPNAPGAISVYATDLDGDGDADVLSSTQYGSQIAWYENQGSGNFGAQKVITLKTIWPKSIYATDLDGDGDADVLSASQKDDKIAWYENQGGSFAHQQNINQPDTTSSNDTLEGNADGAKSVYATDLDGDGDADVLSASAEDAKIAWYENQGGGSFGPQQVITTKAPGAISVYAIDLDGDGDADVLSASDDDDKIAWYENQGGGNFGPQKIINRLDTITNNMPIEGNVRGAREVFATDLDGDGDADVLSASENDGKIAWYENQDPTDRPTAHTPDKQGLSVYPNPTRGALRISGEALRRGQPLQLTVRDLRGRTVAERKLQHPRTQLNLPPGLYSVTIRQGERRAHRKLVVE